VSAQVGPRFLSTGPVDGGGGQPGAAVDGRKLCTPHAQAGPGCPQLRPQKYPGSPQANPPPWCDAFHSLVGQRAFRCRTVDKGVEKWVSPVHNRPFPVGERWTTGRGPCGCPFRPQSVEDGCPHIHNRLSCGHAVRRGPAVDGVGTTRASPGCGHAKRRGPVEKWTTATGNRTGGDGLGARRGRGGEGCGVGDGGWRGRLGLAAGLAGRRRACGGRGRTAVSGREARRELGGRVARAGRRGRVVRRRGREGQRHEGRRGLPEALRAAARRAAVQAVPGGTGAGRYGRCRQLLMRLVSSVTWL
jgi:hypothetical protein